MKVIKCDHCSKCMEQGQQMIHGIVIKGNILENLSLAGITTSVLHGEHFCSLECLKKCLGENNESN